MEKERYCCPICGKFPESYYHAPRLLIKEKRTEEENIVTVEKISLYCRECNYTWEEENDI